MSEIVLSKEVLSVLKEKGSFLRMALNDLNNQPSFRDFCTNHGLLLEEDGGNRSSQRILLHDVKLVLESLCTHLNENTSLSPVPKFLLLYVYELAQGNDLLEQYAFEQLNALVASNRFEYNFKVIRHLQVFDRKDKNGGLLVLQIRDADLLPFSKEMIGFLQFFISISFSTTEGLKKLSPEVVGLELSKLNLNTDERNVTSTPLDDTYEKVIEELGQLVGLTEVKEAINDLSNFLKVQQLRKENGLHTSFNSLHMVFMGPPGTGKTTVARLIGRLYKHLGYLEKGHLVETDRSSLVAGYVGQTAIKTDEVITKAEGGVLFIDEAYSLLSGGLNDYGNEAIEVLLKRMEDNRGNLAVIVAGYPTEMEEFIKSNPGLQSRFNRYFKFEHFPVTSLMEIFKRMAEKSDFQLTEEAEEKLFEIVDRVHENKHEGFGNARTMRNLFEKIVERQANRIVSKEKVSKDDLRNILEDDVPEVLEMVKELEVFN